MTEEDLAGQGGTVANSGEASTVEGNVLSHPQIFPVPLELQPSWMRTSRTPAREDELQSRYDSLEVFPENTLETEQTETKGQLTRTLGVVRDVFEALYPTPPGQPRVNSPLPTPDQREVLFAELAKTHPDLQLYHGGDLDYIGGHWSFSISEALTYTKRGSGGQGRNYPTLRTIQVGDLMAAVSQYSQFRGKTSTREIIGGGNNFGKYEINWRRLAESGYMPTSSIKEFKPPALAIKR